jgi:BirA family biotin operon repressor/biotin-[acetyl-CoA-carboxylase] ligase
MRFDVRRFPSVTSTMDVCRTFAERGACEGLVVLADEQTAGRGRAGRAWYSPPGQSLYLSILLRPNLHPRQIGWLTMLGALAVCEISRETSSTQEADSHSRFSILDSGFKLKWPNDVLLNGKKVAGVLVESSFIGDRLDYVVLGIGLNVNTRFDDAPEEVKLRATSLREALGHEVDREAVLDRLLAAFGARYAMLPASPLADYARRLDTLGKRVRLRAGSEIVEGEALRVEDDGALVVMTYGGERIVTFGDVVSA